MNLANEVSISVRYKNHFTSQMELASAKVFPPKTPIQWVHERHGSLDMAHYY